MTLKLSERELEDLLRQPGKKPKPPADLLARLRADLPAELELTPPAAREPSAPPSKVLRPARWTRPLISLAASLAVLAGGSLIAYRSFRETALPAPAGEAAVAPAPEPAPRAKQERSPAELKNGSDRGSSAEPPPAETRADGQRARTASLQAGGTLGPAAPPKKDLLPPPVAEQLEAAPPPARPLGEAIAGGAGGLLADAKESGAAAAPSESGADERTARPEHPPAAPPPPSAALEVPALDNPGIEANRLQPVAEPQAFGETDKRKEIRRLESPTTQGDLLRSEIPRAAAAAAPKQLDSLAAGADLGDAWRRIERELAAGGWPSQEAIAAARAPEDGESDAPSVRPARRGAEPAADPSAQLREDLLDFLARRSHGRHVLVDLRRRAIRLAEKRPDDERVSSVLRVINLATKLNPD